MYYLFTYSCEFIKKNSLFLVYWKTQIPYHKLWVSLDKYYTILKFLCCIFRYCFFYVIFLFHTIFSSITLVNWNALLIFFNYRLFSSYKYFTCPVVRMSHLFNNIFNLNVLHLIHFYIYFYRAFFEILSAFFKVFKFI